jgi:hypothetical protein
MVRSHYRTINRASKAASSAAAIDPTYLLSAMFFASRGHQFSDEMREGVIGRKLSPDERKALIECIKTL